MASAGKLCLNLSDQRHFAGCFPYINIWKNGDILTVVKDGVDYSTNNPPGHSLSAWDFLDDDGELLNPIPTGVTAIKRLIYQTPTFYGTSSLSPPAGWNVAGVSRAFKFEGTASSVSISGATLDTRVGNRVPFTINSNDTSSTITISGMDTNDPPRRFKVFEVAHETALDAGEHFHPTALDNWQRMAGVLRFMHAQRGAIEQTALGFADLPSVDYHSWTYFTSITGIKGGIPPELIVHIANRTEGHPWISIPLGFFVEKLARIIDISSTNPAVVTSYGHTFANGDELRLYQLPLGDWGTALESGVKTASNVSGNTFEIAVDASAFQDYNTAYLSYMSTPIDLTKATTELTALFGYMRDNTDPMLVNIFELSNEIWNSGPVPKGFMFAHANDRYGDTDLHVQLGGYLTAHMAKVCRDVYGESGRHRWKCLVAAWTSNLWTTEDFITGIQEYIDEQALGLEINDLVQVIAINGYFNGPHRIANKTTLFEWMDESEARFNNGDEATKYSYYDRMVNEERYDGRHIGGSNRVTALPALWPAHKAIADANGMELWQYEGDNHDENMAVDGLWEACDATEQLRLMEFYRATVHSELAAANFTASAENFIAAGGKYPSKFQDYGPVSSFGPWGAMRFVGDHNPLVEAMASFSDDNTLRVRATRTATA